MKKKTKKMKKASKKTRETAHKEDDAEDSAKARSRGPTIDYREFVRTWKDASSVQEVAGALGIKSTSATAIASRLRVRGVALKKFPKRGSQLIDVKSLNKILSGKD